MIILFILICFIYLWIIIYNCIVLNNIRKACNIFIAKYNYEKFIKEKE